MEKLWPHIMSVCGLAKTNCRRTSGNVALMKPMKNCVGCLIQKPKATGTYFYHYHSNLRSDQILHLAHHLCNYHSSKRLHSYQVTSHFSASCKRIDHSRGASTSAHSVLNHRMLDSYQILGKEAARAEREEEAALPPSAQRAELRVIKMMKGAPSEIARERPGSKVLELRTVYAVLNRRRLCTRQTGHESTCPPILRNLSLSSFLLRNV